jgi:large subunit ribosomal protein L30
MLRIEQTRSLNGTPRPQRLVVQSLGLRRIRHVVEREDTKAVRGMIARVPHLVRVIGETP